jgi:hypothetical protein
VDSAWEQKKPKRRKMPESRDESHQSAARFVGQPCANQNADRKPEPRQPDQILQRTLLLTNDKKHKLTNTLAIQRPNKDKPKR